MFAASCQKYLSDVWPCLRPDLSDRGNEHLELAATFSSPGTRGFLSLFSPLSGLLRMLHRLLFVICWHPFIISSPLDARRLLGFFCAFRWLLGVLRALFFTHELPPSPRLGLAGYRSHRNHDPTFVGLSQVKFAEASFHALG